MTDLIAREHWDGIIDPPTDAALESSSYEGTLIGRLDQLHSDWIFSWPECGEVPLMEDAAVLASEEFDALLFNALHGWYRQAIGCLRNALETHDRGCRLGRRRQPEVIRGMESGQQAARLR